jgi:outer membrane protein TolC
MKKLVAMILGVTLLGMVKTTTGAEAPRSDRVVVTPDYLGRLAEEMRTNNPALRSARAMTNAAAADIAAVRTWEDPMAVIGGLAAGDEMRASEGDIIYGMEEKLPLFGKPHLQRNVARAELATETAKADYQFQQSRGELAQAAFRAALAERVVVIGEQDLTWLDSMNQLMENKARVGQASLVDILQIQNERAKRANQLQTDRSQLTQEKVSLNRLLNRAESSPWPEFELPALAGAIAYNQRLVDFALKYEPKTQVQQQQIKRAEAVVAVARRQRLPDVTAGFEARNYSGDGHFQQGMFTLRLSLPWFNHGKIQADIQREQARLAAAQLDLADEQLAIRAELHQLTVKVDAARREALLYRDQIIPRAESTLESVRANWLGGQSAFRDVLDTHRILLEARLMYVRAVAEQYQMLAELVLCCGLGDLSALQMIGADPETGRPATND